MTNTAIATEGTLPDDHFARDVLEGLMAAEKNISSKWLYDQRGSQLFEDITQTEDYYPTRTEAEIFRSMMGELAEIVGTGGSVAEYGSGASVKTRQLIDALEPSLYVPIDIAGEFMEGAVAELSGAYPSLDILPVVADFTRPVTLPDAFNAMDNRLGFFPGSTIGNFEAGKAGEFLSRVRATLGVGAHFLVCADLVKDTQTLKRAYDDSDGVTADFNLNLLARFNRELGADFDITAFRHESVWNEERSRIEMHLVSLKDQTVEIAGQTISFADGEHIHTENSHKYTPDTMRGLAEEAGWRMKKFWTDQRDWFGVFLLSS